MDGVSSPVSTINEDESSSTCLSFPYPPSSSSTSFLFSLLHPVLNISLLGVFAFLYYLCSLFLGLLCFAKFLLLVFGSDALQKSSFDSHRGSHRIESRSRNCRGKGEYLSATKQPYCKWVGFPNFLLGGRSVSSSEHLASNSSTNLNLRKEVSAMYSSSSITDSYGKLSERFTSIFANDVYDEDAIQSLHDSGDERKRFLPRLDGNGREIRLTKEVSMSVPTLRGTGFDTTDDETPDSNYSHRKYRGNDTGCANTSSDSGNGDNKEKGKRKNIGNFSNSRFEAPKYRIFDKMNSCRIHA